MDHAGVVVVGSGAAGATAVGTIRRSGYEGRIVVVQGEEGMPYNRTTVNKALLQGLVSVDAVTLPEAETPDIDWTGVDPATALDSTSRTVTLASGRSLSYENLIIATGARPTPFPGEAIGVVRNRVLTLRTAADTDRLRRRVIDGDVESTGTTGVTILGAGLIGAETASVLSAAGVPVCLVSSSVTPMAAQLGRITGTHLAALHERHVETHFGHTVTHVKLEGRHRVVASLTGGRNISSSVLLVAIGVTPGTGWLNGSSLDTSDGIAVDQRLRAKGATGVYAAGDLARITDADGRGHRIEHWNHAVAQGRHAAVTLLHDAGLGEDPGAFHQLSSHSVRLYGTRLTFVGRPGRFIHETLVHGEPEHERFSVALTDENHRLVGAVGVGDTRLVNALKPAIHAGEPIDAALSLTGVH